MLSLSRPLTSYSKVQIAYSSLVRNTRAQLRRVDYSTKRYLNVGCGPNIVRNFLNLDYFWRPGIDICWDIGRGLPLKTDTFKGIFSEHCLEHLPVIMSMEVLKEFYRTLEVGGTLRLILPDAGLYLETYARRMRGESVLFPYETTQSDHLATPISHVNRVFRDYGHQYAYDFETIATMLATAGFHSIEKRAYRSGRDPLLLVDQESRKIESLYAEGVKAA